jgi:hypothetical protein
MTEIEPRRGPQPYEPAKIEQREVVSGPLIGFATITSNPTGGT